MIVVVITIICFLLLILQEFGVKTEDVLEASLYLFVFVPLTICFVLPWLIVTYPLEKFSNYRYFKRKEKGLI